MKRNTALNTLNTPLGIQAEAFFRTFRLAYDGHAGASFAIDHDGRQYLVTARHLVPGIKDGDKIGLVLADGNSLDLPVKLVGIGEGDIDVAVLALPQLVASPRLTLLVGNSVSIGQEAFFLGYPFGENVARLKDPYARAFVKKATISGNIDFGGELLWYLDCMTVEGFSGGPVVYRSRQGGTMRVLAIMKGYRNKARVVRSGEDPDSPDTPFFFPENTGIAAAFDARIAVNMILANPIGFQFVNPAQATSADPTPTGGQQL